MLSPGLTGLLAPPLCVVCRSSCDPALPVCPECVGELNRATVIRGSPPPGVAVLASCAAHEGVARAVLAAFKFRRMPGLAPLIAGYMADVSAAGREGRLLVPIPAASFRRRWRGFDPAEGLAVEIARIDSDFQLAREMLVRCGPGRQRGRGRDARLGNPPRIEPGRRLESCPKGKPVTLVDDVTTTGATLSACAAVLLETGAGPVSAVTFTRRL